MANKEKKTFNVQRSTLNAQSKTEKRAAPAVQVGKPGVQKVSNVVSAEQKAQEAERERTRYRHPSELSEARGQNPEIKGKPRKAKSPRGQLRKANSPLG